MKLLAPIIALLFATTLSAQQLISVSEQENFSEEFLNVVLPSGANYGLITYRVIYTMPNLAGESTEVSGMLSVPYDSDGADLAFPLAVYNHGTAGTRMGVPGTLNNGERTLVNVIAAQGFITLAPDYLGLGHDTENLHPYVHAETEAAAGRNMIAAVKSWLTEQEQGFTDQLFLTGYSQGGHASAALHMDIDLNPGDDNLTVTAAAHLSGPYSISEVMANIVLENTGTTFPGYLAYTYISYNEAYGIYDDLSSVFVEPYLAPIQEFAAGNTELNDVNSTLFSLIASNSASLQDIFQDSVINAIANEPEHPVNVALRDNDVYEWAPSAPTILFYCTEDEQVPFRNAILADSVMTALGAPSVEARDGGPNDHGGCVVPAVSTTLILFNIFGEVTTGIHPLQVSELELSPNPVTSGGRLQLASQLEEEVNYQLISATGKIVSNGVKLPGQSVVRLPEIPAGLYYLRTQWDGKLGINRIIVE